MARCSGAANGLAGSPTRQRAFRLPVNEAGIFDFQLERIQPVARRWLVRRGIVHDRNSLLSSFGAKLMNAQQERWDTLKFAGSATVFKSYDHWHERLWRRIDIEGIDSPRSD